MAFSFEDDPDLDYLDDLGSDDVLSDDETGVEGYDDEDFQAMGLDPNLPTVAKPGSEAKVMTLAARYAHGLPLWNGEDCYDHGPGERERLNKSRSKS
ncbi:MAG: hypothetical protein O2955_12105 [Planctomycetota bacterium]|nr:hypothetical protein [Planctomycetota bacterium]MDA1213254.1 hypothetical protein [Planctomycetota bacterium]